MNAARLASLALVFFVLAWLAAGCGGVPEPRNVVLVLIDTLRADGLGAYGRDPSPTPFLDRLAAESVVFEHAYAPAPWTLPSTVSLLTSLPLCEHGVAVDGDRVPADVTPLAERLRDAGFATASFFTNPYAGRMSGLDRGFQRGHREPDGTGGPKVRRWLESIGDQPFFLYVHNTEPHDPYEAPVPAELGRVALEKRRWANDLIQHYRRLTRIDWAEGQPRGTARNGREQAAALVSLERLRESLQVLYLADVRDADARLASIVAELRNAGVYEETLLLVVSDHGEAFGEHGGWQHDHALYDEVVRVPLVMRLPRGVHGGRRIAEPVSLLDVAPTIADALGDATLAEGSRGRSLLPLLSRRGPAEPRVVSTRWNLKKQLAGALGRSGDLNVAVREGRWKAIWNAEPGTVELYDLAEDPGETRDVFAANPEIAGRLADVARAHARPCADARRESPVAPELDEATREQLEHLGYIDP